jgi:hypothetical protein
MQPVAAAAVAGGRCVALWPALLPLHVMPLVTPMAAPRVRCYYNQRTSLRLYRYHRRVWRSTMQLATCVCGQVGGSSRPYKTARCANPDVRMSLIGSTEPDVTFRNFAMGQQGRDYDLAWLWKTSVSLRSEFVPRQPYIVSDEPGRCSLTDPTPLHGSIEPQRCTKCCKCVCLQQCHPPHLRSLHPRPPPRPKISQHTDSSLSLPLEQLAPSSLRRPATGVSRCPAASQPLPATSKPPPQSPGSRYNFAPSSHRSAAAHKGSPLPPTAASSLAANRANQQPVNCCPQQPPV